MINMNSARAIWKPANRILNSNVGLMSKPPDLNGLCRRCEQLTVSPGPDIGKEAQERHTLIKSAPSIQRPDGPGSDQPDARRKAIQNQATGEVVLMGAGGSVCGWYNMKPGQHRNDARRGCSRYRAAVAGKDDRRQNDWSP